MRRGHIHEPLVRVVGPFSMFCASCGETLGFGPSNDDPDTVYVEMRAVQLTSGRARLNPGERLGRRGHLSGGTPASLAEEAGWLHREMLTHEDREQRDRDAWPWDITQPIAGQYEEWARLRADVHERFAAYKVAKEARSR